MRPVLSCVAASHKIPVMSVHVLFFFVFFPLLVTSKSVCVSSPPGNNLSCQLGEWFGGIIYTRTHACCPMTVARKYTVLLSRSDYTVSALSGRFSLGFFEPPEHRFLFFVFLTRPRRLPLSLTWLSSLFGRQEVPPGVWRLTGSDTRRTSLVWILSSVDEETHLRSHCRTPPRPPLVTLTDHFHLGLLLF